MREEGRWGVGGGGSDPTYQTCFEEDHSMCKNRQKDCAGLGKISIKTLPETFSWFVTRT